MSTLGEYESPLGFALISCAALAGVLYRFAEMFRLF